LLFRGLKIGHEVFGKWLEFEFGIQLNTAKLRLFRVIKNQGLWGTSFTVATRLLESGYICAVSFQGYTFVLIYFCF